MVSRWYGLKSRAVGLRKRGQSIREIEASLNIPRSTLSGWFKDIKLSETQEQTLRQNWLRALVKARTKAVQWHNQQKKLRLKKARAQALAVLNKIDTTRSDLIDLAMAILYLGEGGKKNIGLSLGSSDPLILKFFLACLRKNYNLPIEKIKCSLHLRSDQNPEKLKRFWSKELNIPQENFTRSSIDKRTTNNPTYPNYKGVCVVNCGAVEIQRKLMYIANGYCEKVIKKYLGS